MVTERSAYFIMFFILGFSIIIITYIFIDKNIVNKAAPAIRPRKIVNETEYSEKLNKYTINTVLDLVDVISDDTKPNWCVPTYYAHRPVEVSSGKYGDLSPWSLFPVVSSPNVRSPNVEIGDKACVTSVVVIGFQAKIDTTVKDIVYNVHRQVGSLDSESDGEIIGVLNPVAIKIKTGSENTITYNSVIYDSRNPNKSYTECNQC